MQISRNIANEPKSNS